MILGQVFNPKTICVNLESEEKEEVFEELVEKVVALKPNLNRQNILNAILERESLMSTGIKEGIAVPHGKLDEIDEVMGVVGISKSGIDYEALDNKPVHLVFLLLSSKNNAEFHLRVLRHLSTVIEANGFVAELMEQTDADGVYQIICKYDRELN
jgi:PTS system fructose-specific IIC component/PTS system nitrogen regulatory IIA component